MCKVSVIVPVYNVEPYIARCVRSIKAQSFADFECLLVDDASPDGSIAIARPLVADDARFRFLRHERNQGLGPARNTGIAAAKAEFVCFVDSDDFVEPDYIRLLYETAVRQQAEIVACDFRVIGANGKTKIDGNSVAARHWSEAALNILSGADIGVAWRRIYKKRLFDHRLFPEGLFEDWCTNFALIAGNKIAPIPFVEKPLYNYCVGRQGSIMSRKWSRQHIDSTCNGIALVSWEAEKSNVRNSPLADEFRMSILTRLDWLAIHTVELSRQPVQDLSYCRNELERILPAGIYRDSIWGGALTSPAAWFRRGGAQALRRLVIHLVIFKGGRGGVTLLRWLVKARRALRKGLQRLRS